MTALAVWFGAVSVLVVLAQIFLDEILLLIKLPGDTHIKRENTEFSFPFVPSWGRSLKSLGVGWLKSCFSTK